MTPRGPREASIQHPAQRAKRRERRVQRKSPCVMLSPKFFFFSYKWLPSCRLEGGIRMSSKKPKVTARNYSARSLSQIIQEREKGGSPVTPLALLPRIFPTRISPTKGRKTTILKMTLSKISKKT